MSDAPFDKERIESFLANKSTAGEASQIADFLSANVQELDRIRMFEDLQDEELIRTPDAVKEAILARMLPKAKIVSMWTRYLVAAGCVAALVALSVWLFRDKGANAPDNMAGFIEVVNHSQQDSLLVLPDRSTALLAPGAVMRYAEDFREMRAIRQVEGSVLYKVEKDTAHPFEVEAMGIATRAVGTMFRVSGQQGGHQLIVSLEEGKVVLNSREPAFELKDLYLVPGQTCYVNKQSGQIRIQDAAAPAPASSAKPPKGFDTQIPGITWTSREIQFNQVALTSIFARLEEQYQVRIELQDSAIAHTKFTGRIFYTDSLDTLLKAICEINQLTYQFRDNKYFISSNQSQ